MNRSDQSEQGKRKLLSELKDTRKRILVAALGLPVEAQNEAFLGSWDVKDLLAHLEGWDNANRQVIGEVLEGNLPSFYEFIDRDWRSYNARLVEIYRKEDIHQLVEDVSTPHCSLIAALEGVPAQEFECDHGVRNKGW